MPPSYRPAGPTVCLEVKPKCGFVPSHSVSVEAHEVKLQYPRFVLHMLMKHVVVGRGWEPCTVKPGGRAVCAPLAFPARRAYEMGRGVSARLHVLVLL